MISTPWMGVVFAIVALAGMALYGLVEQRRLKKNANRTRFAGVATGLAALGKATRDRSEPEEPTLSTLGLKTLLVKTAKGDHSVPLTGKGLFVSTGYFQRPGVTAKPEVNPELVERIEALRASGKLRLYDPKIGNLTGDADMGPTHKAKASAVRWRRPHLSTQEDPKDL